MMRVGLGRALISMFLAGKMASIACPRCKSFVPAGAIGADRPEARHPRALYSAAQQSQISSEFDFVSSSITWISKSLALGLLLGLLAMSSEASASSYTKKRSAAEDEVTLGTPGTLIAVGTAAAAFGAQGYSTSQKTQLEIQKLWQDRTTIRSLRETAEAGEMLPDVCIVAGRLAASGAPVAPIASEMQSLRPLLGYVDAMENSWLESAKSFKNLPKEEQKVLQGLAGSELSADNIQEVNDASANQESRRPTFDTDRDGRISKEEFAATMTSQWQKKMSDAEIEEAFAFFDKNGDGYITIDEVREVLGEANAETDDEEWDKARAMLADLQNTANGFVLTEFVLSRSFVNACLEKDERDNEVLKRKERSFCYNVLHERRQSAGLHFVGLAGEEASLELPEFNIESGKASALFMPVEDVWHSFASAGQVKESPIGTPTVYKSKFMALDVSSSDDMGKSFSSNNSAKESEAREAWSDVFKGSVLEELGMLLPKGWQWNPQGFYDKRLYADEDADNMETIDFNMFRERMERAPQRNEDKTIYKKDSQSLNDLRDKEFGFRISEMCVPVCDVTLVAKPVYQPDSGDGRKIRLVDPEGSQGDFNSTFQILKGHKVEGLLKNKIQQANAYIGLMAGGAACIVAGLSNIKVF